MHMKNITLKYFQKNVREENIKTKNYIDMELESESDSDSDNGIYIDIDNEE